MEKLERTLNEVATDMEQTPEEAPPPSKKGKKVAKAKKVVKKKATKSEKAKPGNKEGLILLSDLASEAGITTAGARRKLREAELSREGRWAWEEGSKDYKAARKALGLED